MIIITEDVVKNLFFFLSKKKNANAAIFFFNQHKYDIMSQAEQHYFSLTLIFLVYYFKDYYNSTLF